MSRRNFPSNGAFGLGSKTVKNNTFAHNRTHVTNAACHIMQAIVSKSGVRDFFSSLSQTLLKYKIYKKNQFIEWLKASTAGLSAYKS